MINTSTAQSPGRGATILAWSALGVVTLAEALVATVSLQLGLFVHLGLSVLLLVFAVFGSDRAVGELCLGMILVSMVRVLSVGLPLNAVPQFVWYPLVAAPIYLSIGVVMWQTGLSAPDVGLRWGNVPRELAFGAGGITLGVVEYNILRPESLLRSQSLPHLVLVIVILLVFTGVFEELLFRGVLQQLALRALEIPGLVLASLLFAAMHIGYRSLIDLAFVGAVGALFAYVAFRGGSLLGVSLAHGLTNVILFVVMPAVARSPGSQAASTMVGLAWAGAALSLSALLGLVLARPKPSTRSKR